MVKIKGIKIDNYKGLEKIEVIDLEDLTIFIGRNNSGKSSILEAISLFLRPEVSVDESKFFKTTDGEMKKPLSIKCLMELPSQIVENFKKGGLPTDAFQIVDKYCRDVWIVKRYDAPGSKQITLFDEFKYESELKKSLYDSSLIEPIRSEVRKGFQSWLNLNSTKFSFVQAGSRSISSNDFHFLERNTSSSPIVGKLHELKDGSKRRQYEDFVESLSKLDLSFKKIDVRKGNETFVQRGEKEDGTIIDLPLSNEGSGHKDMVALYWAISNREDQLLLVDEPENFKHPSLQRKVLGELIQRAHQKQIFISTQSSIFSQPGKRRAIYLVKNPAADSSVRVTKIKCPGDLKNIKHEIGIRNADFLNAEMVLIVEGETEEKALPVIFDALGHDFGDLGIMLMNISGYSKVKVKRLKELFDFLRSVDTAPYLFLDNHEAASADRDDFLRAYHDFLNNDQFIIWDGEFEHNFTNEQLYSAVKKLCDEYGKEINKTLEEFSTERKNIPANEVSHFLARIFADVCGCHQSNFPKPEFGSLIGEVVAKEIQENSPSRTRTQVETELLKLFEFYRKQKE